MISSLFRLERKDLQGCGSFLFVCVEGKQEELQYGIMTEGNVKER